MNLQVFLEWFHRLDAFVIGVALLVVAIAATALRRRLPRWLPWFSVLLLVMVALQGGLGALTVPSTSPVPGGDGSSRRCIGPGGPAQCGDPATAPPAVGCPPFWWRPLSGLALVAVIAQCLLGGRMATTWAAQRCLAGEGLSLGLPASLRGHSRGSTGAAVRFGGSARGWLEPSSVALVAVGRSAGRCPGASGSPPFDWGCINLSSPSPISWWLRCWWVSWRLSRLGVPVPSSPPVLPSSLTTPLWRLAMADVTVAALPTRERVVPSGNGSNFRPGLKWPNRG